MKKSKEKIYRGYEINTGKFNNLSYYPKIVDRIIDQIINLLDHHSRITVLRIDPKYPDLPGMTIMQKNRAISTFIDKVKKQLLLSKWGNKQQVAHGWILEKGEQNGSTHHHLFLAFETSFRNLGSFNPQNPTGFWKFLVNCARETFGGSLHFVSIDTVNRNSPSEIKACIKHLSYLAKSRTKDFGTKETHKRFSFSQIRPSKYTPTQKAPKNALKQAPEATPGYPIGIPKKIDYTMPQTV